MFLLDRQPKKNIIKSHVKTILYHQCFQHFKVHKKKQFPWRILIHKHFCCFSYPQSSKSIIVIFYSRGLYSQIKWQRNFPARGLMILLNSSRGSKSTSVCDRFLFEYLKCYFLKQRLGSKKIAQAEM